MLLSISYDLRQPGRDYDELYETIKSAPSWCHAMDSLWFIRITESVDSWSNKLRNAMDGNDWLFVVDITGQSRQGWLKKDVWDWINNNNY